MRVLIVAEGKHERHGALETLVRRLVSIEIHCDLDRLSRNDIHAHHGRGQGYFKRALRWMLHAEKRGYDALVLLIDEDNRHERLQELAKAQDHDITPIRRALGVAIRTFDAWMLADEQALIEVLGYAVPRQPNPETIADPKRSCRNLLEASSNTLSQADMYLAVMRITDIETLKTLCPKGFAPFVERVQRLNALP